MAIFGKDYNKEISDLINQMNRNTESINNLIKRFNQLDTNYDSMTELMIKSSSVQAQHAAIVKFLMNHATVDENSREDLQRMLQDIVKYGKEAKKNG